MKSLNGKILWQFIFSLTLRQLLKLAIYSKQ